MAFCILRPIWAIEVCIPSDLGMSNSVLMLVFIHGTLIHPSSPPLSPLLLQILISGWNQANINFF